MRIKDIKDEKIRALALKRCENGFGLESRLIDAFIWSDTPKEEGFDFWSKVFHETRLELKQLNK